MFEGIDGSVTDYHDRYRYAKKKIKNCSHYYADYFASHIWDEIDPKGKLAEFPHHIRTRGAHGNIDQPWNLLALSPENHRLWHQIGPDAFYRKFAMSRRDVLKKIRHALDRRIE
jgi:hypothetical protein